MVGHLFGYEAALAIDAQALPLRAARAVVEAALERGGAAGGQGPAADRYGDQLLAGLQPALAGASAAFFEGLRGRGLQRPSRGAARRCACRRSCATPPAPCRVEGYELEYGKVGTPGALVDDLVDALTTAIDQLTRPIDAIKHQAKTVTVGISRSEEALFGVRPGPARCSRPARRGTTSSYRALRTLAELDPAVADGGRLHPLPHRGRDRRPGRHHPRRRPGRHRRRAPVADRSQPAAAGHQAPGGRGAGGHRGPGPQRRPHGDPRARDQGRRGHRA